MEPTGVRRHGRPSPRQERREVDGINFVKQFGVSATTRNWNTIEKIAKILRAA
jgi:uncharacterized protein (DUF1697 family)